MNQTLPSLRMVILSSLLSASLTVLGLSLASDRIAALTTAAPQTQPDAPLVHTYQVRRGDTLSLIASRELGNRERWRDLYQANRDRVHAPSQLEVGTTLRLPGTER